MNELIPPLRVALLGAGTVGGQVARLLTENAADLGARVGRPLELVGIAVRDTAADRGPGVDRALLTDDAAGLVRRADIVVEVMGGIHPAKDLLISAIASGASVVTANKALLAAEGTDIYEAADAAGVDVYYEAAVAGAIPLVRPIRESLAGDNISRILGIVNGTTNYVLDAMSRTGASFADALASAQELGYAEADPTADVEGLDAAAKAAILASLAFHSRVTSDDVYAEGISAVTEDDIRAAQVLDQVVKLLAVAEIVEGPDGQQRISARVHPVMLPAQHPLASVSGAYNAVFVEAESAGNLMFYGAGAGGPETASAVLGDVVSAARNRLAGGKSPAESAYAERPTLRIEETESAFYLALVVHDRPGVLATITRYFGEHGVSVALMRQTGLAISGSGGAPGRDAAYASYPDAAKLRFVTHRARESDMAVLVEDLRGVSSVISVQSVMRVEGA